ncbi:MAG: hypothetical protein A3J79_14845 [Elusimicrobia bacterium RIFOXYB2_FULL_62_6]|nr:MAG: hypothetical protein A3J79_14845 [Elusimicrobia bacterium RIFOXYB2_FULL_62_6]
MKIATTVLAAVIIGMAVYFLAKDNRLSKFMNSAAEKEYVKPPEIGLSESKFGLKDGGESEAPPAPDPHAEESDD